MNKKYTQFRYRFIQKKFISENGVTTAEDTDIALLNADKNNNTIRINHKSTKNQTNHFIST